MNKDFFTKPISLKDLKIPKINFSNIKNNKLVIVCIFIIIFFIVMLVVGFNLMDKRNEAKQKQIVVENKYMSLQRMASKEVIENEMIMLKDELSNYEEILEAVKPREFAEIILKDFKQDSPIKWDDVNADINIVTVKGFEEFSTYKVNIKSFTGSLEDIENFLTYVKEYEKVVRIDSLNFSKNELTGKLSGKVSLSFYFNKIEE